MKLSKVSIITVCYNSEKTIEQTICSVLNQTYSDIEYIIVDGGSQDHTLDIVRKYDTNIILISEADDGLYHAMNKGIMKSSGEIVGIINSDDWYENNAVELAVEYLNKENCDLVYGRCTNVYDDGIMVERDSGKLEDLKYKSVILHPTVFVRKVIYEKYGIFNQRYAILADYDLMLRFYECGVKMVAMPQNRIFFRMSGVSNTNCKDAIMEMKKIALSHWDGESADIRGKIEKCSEEGLAYAQIQNDMNKIKQDLNEIIAKVFHLQNNYVIFGAGGYGVKCLQVFGKSGCHIEYFADNDCKKWGKMCGNIEIKSPECLRNDHKNIIIASVHYKEELRQQLENMGYQLGIDCVFAEDIIKEALG